MAETKTSKKNEDDVFITDLTIHKVRHLKDIRPIHLSKDERKHLILTGKNGSGKTSVLESLKTYLDKSLHDGLLLSSKEGWRIFKDREIYKCLSVEFNELNKFFEYHPTGHFLLGFYGAKRLADMKVPKGIEKIDLKEQYQIDEKPGQDFIQYIVNLKADKSFARDEEDYETATNIDNWFDIFRNSLKEIFEDSSLKLEFDRKNYNFNIIQKGKAPFDFNTLADGYSAIINVVSDLILKMEKHRTKSYDVQGLVLIDELESHLHIDLQKKIFPFLTRFFPRIQFIVSTHSPFVLSSIENAVIYDLEKKLQVSDLSGYAYDGIVEGYFGNDKYSELAKRNLETYEQLVNQKKRSEEEEDRMIELRRYLREIPGSLAPGLKVRFQQIELKRKGKRND